MSSYIIAGSADSLDTAFCEQIARRIKAKYKNIDFRIVIKHPSQWDDYLNQICRIYGFLKKSNPIIYTYHGKIIGNKDAFISNAIKYFGLGEENLIVNNLSTAVNVKLANEQLQQKKIIKNNIKTLPQKIKTAYQRLLKQGVLKHQYKQKDQYLVNGIQYYFRQVQGICPAISFPQNYNVTVERENIQASNLNLMELSLQDQITPEQVGKQPFVTQNNQNQVLNTESMEKMSEASRTNKLQSSVMSKDQDSKIIKESNRQKQKIDQQFDDVADYTNVNMQPTFICQLGDHFCLAFQPKSHIPGQMVFYHNQSQNNGNSLRVYNDRPVIGHHTIIKQIHFIGDQAGFQNKQISQNLLKEQQQQKEDQEQKQKQQQQQKKQDQQAQDQHKQKKEQHNPAEKSKTQPNIPLQKQKKQSQLQQAISQPCSVLNLVSNLNYHTLYILKPFSNLQIKYLLMITKETNSVACLQFLPQNPNPRIRVYNRSMLIDSHNSLFPVENFIEKQLQDGLIEHINLPRQQNENKDSQKVNFLKINGLDFNHLYYQFPQNIGEEELLKVLKVGIDQILFLEQKLKKQIGYNLVFTKKYIMLIALTSPYRIYGPNNLYFDGLAYLGYVHIAKVVSGYHLNQQKIDSGKKINQALAKSSAFQLNDD